MIPLGFKLAWTAALLLIVPVYAIEHGLVNFLWLSDIALIVGCVAAWRESARLASMMLVATLLFEFMWLFDFSAALLSGGESPTGLVAYMFNADDSLFLRSLSLFHVPLPFALIWMTRRLGYDPKAWRTWVFIGIGVLVLTYLVTEPGREVNWVHGPPGYEHLLQGPAWLVVVILASVFAWWLTHRLVLAVARRKNWLRA